jgi:hypothetical protein
MKNFALIGASGAIVVSALVACSSASETPDVSSGIVDQDAGPARDGSVYDSAVSPESGLGELLFRPSQVYSGTDGTHTFKIPIAVYDSDSDLAVTASDGTALTLTPATLKNPVDSDGITDNGKYFLITVKKAGSYTLTATSKGRSTTASVTITSYAAGRYAAGQTRYEQAGTGPDRPCTTCHVNGASIDHSPAALATATDQEIGIIITTGVKPGPTVIRIDSEPGTQHRWNVTDAERDGLITFLRGIEPRGFQ